MTACSFRSRLLVAIAGEDLGKAVFIGNEIFSQPPQLHFHHRRHRIRADVVTGEAGAAIVLDVVGAAEIMDVLVLRVGVIPHFASAVRTAKEVAEDALRAVFLFRCALFRCTQHFLHLLVGLAVDDCFVLVLEHQPFLFRVVDTAVILERLGVRFEVQHIAAVFLPLQDLIHGIRLPLVRIRLRFLSAAVDTFGRPVRRTVEMLFILEYSCDSVLAVALKIESENLLDDCRCVGINDPMLLVLRVLHITVWRLAKGFSRFAAHIVGRPDFTDDILGVKLVHDILNRDKIVHIRRPVETVHVIVDGDKADVVIGEIAFGIFSRVSVKHRIQTFYR